MSRALQKRIFQANGYYHVFNRGNNKQKIFHDKKDYEYFLNLFECYLVKHSKTRPNWIKHTFEKEIRLVTYCLMPNHFHLLIQQIPTKSISSFLHVIMLRYTKYYNKKYKHIGHVFQGSFKARLITTDGDLVHVSRYIHRNAEDVMKNFLHYPYSSARYFISKTLSAPSWLHPGDIFTYMHGIFGTKKNMLENTYRNYLLM